MKRLTCLSLLMLLTQVASAESQPVLPIFENLQSVDDIDRSIDYLNHLKTSILNQNKTEMAPNFCYGSPVGTHWINSVDAYGDILEMEDGSWWKVSAGDNRVVLSWRTGDPLAIIPNHSWFSSYSYYITNRNNGTYVKANLSNGPIAFGDNSHWLAALDYNTGYLYLEDNSCWSVANNDAPIFQNWGVNDTIIIGFNDSWFSSYNYILINVNMNSYLRAKQY